MIFVRLDYLRNSLKILSKTFIKYPELNKFPEALESLLKEKYAPYTSDDIQHAGLGNIVKVSAPPKNPVKLLNFWCI